MAKSGLIDFKSWAKDAFGKYSPWGDEDSPALMAEVESSLERQLVEKTEFGGSETRALALDERLHLAQRQVAMLVEQIRSSPGDVRCQPLPVRERHHAILRALPYGDRHVDVGEIEAEREGARGKADDQRLPHDELRHQS